MLSTFFRCQWTFLANLNPWVSWTCKTYANCVLFVCFFKKNLNSREYKKETESPPTLLTLRPSEMQCITACLCPSFRPPTHKWFSIPHWGIRGGEPCPRACLWGRGNPCTHSYMGKGWAAATSDGQPKHPPRRRSAPDRLCAGQSLIAKLGVMKVHYDLFIFFFFFKISAVIHKRR